MDHSNYSVVQNSLDYIECMLNNVENKANDKESVSAHLLDDDCLRMIFSAIDHKTLRSLNFQLVCKRWLILANSIVFRRARLNFLLVKEEEVSCEDGNFIYISKSLASFVKALYFSGEQVTELILSSSHYTMCIESAVNSYMLAIKRLCPHLSKLTIDRFICWSNCELDEVQYCFPQNLTKLTLSHSWISDDILSQILKLSYKTLQKLKLTKVGLKVKECSIISYLAECQLRVLDLYGVYRIMPGIFPFIFSTYQDTLEKLCINTVHLTTPIPDGVIMKRLKSVTFYETLDLRSEFGIPIHDEAIFLTLFRAMENVEKLCIFTESSPFLRRFKTCQYFDYLSLIMMLRNLNSLTLPLEPMKRNSFGDNSILKNLKDSGVKIRIDSNY